MDCKKVMELLECQSPVEYACDWDNVGLLVGREDKEVKKIYIALDAEDRAIDEAIAAKADMLLTHHPMIFKGMKKVTSQDFIGKRVMRLIREDIAYYAMHTNFDVKGMADLAAQYLGLREMSVLEPTFESKDGVEGIGRYGKLEKELSLGTFCETVKEAFALENAKVFGKLEKRVSTAAVSPGSGKSVIGKALEAGVDVLVTGDIDHHEGIDAVAQGMAVIDAGHYGVEHIFISYMEQYLKREAPELEVEIQPLTFPFQII
ncbi:MAG: Nif3-like dinuclear metal center hexameric protein [Lachnospiraceae bacterium]|nr:Nif3-like dinuclear metal center hexameric protein [Lachnospiraceae bacterium]